MVDYKEKIKEYFINISDEGYGISVYQFKGYTLDDSSLIQISIYGNNMPIKSTNLKDSILRLEEVSINS